MIDFRWVVDGRGERELQYRTAFGIDASGALCPGAWSEWETVRVEMAAAGESGSVEPEAENGVDR